MGLWQHGDSKPVLLPKNPTGYGQLLRKMLYLDFPTLLAGGAYLPLIIQSLHNFVTVQTLVTFMRFLNLVNILLAS